MKRVNINKNTWPALMHTSFTGYSESQCQIVKENAIKRFKIVTHFKYKRRITIADFNNS